MKKILALILIVVVGVALSGCTNEKEDVHLKIMVPSGSPALAQTYMESTLPSLGEHVTYEIEVVSGPTPLAAAFSSGSHDIIFAPTNLGAMLIASGVEYQLAATVVWGNLYLATGTDDSFAMADLEGQEIVVFGEGATPHIILKALVDNYNYTNPPTFTFVDSAGTANAQLIQDPSKIVLLAEPVLSVAALPSNVSNLKSIDLQVEWENLTGSSSYPQAGIFVKTELDSEVVNAYLEQVEIALDYAVSNPAEVAQMGVDLGYTFPLPVMTNAIPRSHLEYVSAVDTKTALEEYFSYIIDFNPALIGGSLPAEDFYYDE